MEIINQQSGKYSIPERRTFNFFPILHITKFAQSRHLIDDCLDLHVFFAHWNDHVGRRGYKERIEQNTYTLRSQEFRVWRTLSRITWVIGESWDSALSNDTLESPRLKMSARINLPWISALRPPLAAALNRPTTPLSPFKSTEESTNSKTADFGACNFGRNSGRVLAYLGHVASDDCADADTLGAWDACVGVLVPSCRGLGLEGLDTERVRSAVSRAGVNASSVSCGETRDRWIYIESCVACVGITWS